MLDVRHYPRGPKTIYCAGLPLPVATETMLRRAKTAIRGDDVVYYLRNFILAFNLAPDEDLSRITIANIRAFADGLADAGKSASVCVAYASIIDDYFAEYRSLGGCIHDTLVRGDAIYAASHGRRSRDMGYRTLAGEVIRARTARKACASVEPRYDKWLTADQIEIVSQTLTLRDRCIFQLGLNTGYRISSVLSIKLVPGDLRAGIVSETMSKTGKLHKATIEPDLRDLIARYVNTDRARAVIKAGTDCGALFLASKGPYVGQPLTYDAYRHSLKFAESIIRQRYPQYAGITLHSHAGRSTYLTRLVEQNEENKAKGLPYRTDQDILNLMDWSSQQCLRNYYDYRSSGCRESTLWADLTDP